jgi:DNA-directed RNA polymerase subunit H (RpoH/RPB5)
LKKKREVPTADVLSHFLVPQMKVLSDSEKSKLFSKFGIDEHKLPRVPSKDPTVAALKAVVGNVIRIERDDGTGKYTTYRVVV